MADYNSQLKSLHEKLARKAKIKAMLASLRSQLATLQEKERQLSAAATAEQEDVNRLERVSLASILSTIAGSKEEKLDKERAEAYAAALKHDAAARQVESAQQEIFSLHSELQTLSGVEAEYKAVLSAKSDALKAADPARGAEICRIEDRLAAIAAESKEIDEALSAGKSVLRKLTSIEKELNSAKGWGTWDLFGGGLVSDMIKYSHLDDAQAQINALQNDLRRYQTELADVTLRADLQVQTGGFLRFADYFFDDIFSSLAVLNRIRNSQNEISDVRSRVNSIQSQLERMKAALRQEASNLKTSLNETILNA